MDEIKNEVIIYKSEEGPEFLVKMRNESVWMSLQQIADLFGRDKSVISRHIKNIYKEAELSRNSVVAKYATTGSDGKTYQVEYFNLDMIISVGYRVNSRRGTHFRIWATQRLRDYIIKGFAVNEQRLKDKSQAKLKELEGAVKLLQRAAESQRASGFEKELFAVIAEYTQTWTLLHQFDEGEVPPGGGKAVQTSLEYDRLLTQIEQFSQRLKKAGFVEKQFGQERGRAFKEIVGAVNSQSGEVAQNGALLFYSIIKDEPFLGGNKQIASLLLLVYLVNNNYFYTKRGERKLSDAAVAVLSILVEESRREDRSVVLQLIASMINKK